MGLMSLQNRLVEAVGFSFPLCLCSKLNNQLSIYSCLPIAGCTSRVMFTPASIDGALLHGQVSVCMGAGRTVKFWVTMALSSNVICQSIISSWALARLQGSGLGPKGLPLRQICMVPGFFLLLLLLPKALWMSLLSFARYLESHVLPTWPGCLAESAHLLSHTWLGITKLGIIPAHQEMAGTWDSAA